MKGKDKDKKPGFPDFLKYRGNNLSGNEKNSYERELQKDPFAAEAEEGFSSVDPSILSNDMKDLEKRLLSRTRKNTRFVWYRIAASVAVLMVITTVFFIVQKDKPVEMALNGLKEETFEIEKPEVLKKNVPAPSVAMNQEKRSDEKSPLKEEKINISAGAGKMKTEDIRLPDTIEIKADQLISAVAEEEKAEALPKDLKMTAAARSAVKSQELRLVRGKVISSEDNLPIPGATIMIRGTSVATTTDTEGNFTLTIPEKTKPDLVANYIGMKRKEFNATADSVVNVTMDPDLTSLDEVVVVGYGVSAGEKAFDNPSYIAAEPVTGRTAFNKYIDQNITRPGGGKEKEVVVLSFTVKLNGQPSNIKVVRSPGKNFSDEAIRLIEGGPKWKPASANGINIEDEVRVRIVFK